MRARSLTIALVLTLCSSASGDIKKSVSSENITQANLEGASIQRMVDSQDALYVAEVEEIRVSPVVSRKGYLNFLEEKKKGWHKRWVVGVAKK